MVMRQDASTGQLVEMNEPDAKAPAKKKELALRIKVYSPFKVYYDGEANSISAENDTGPFDILPRHHRFMTLLNPCDIVIRTKEKEQHIRITRGIMHVRQDQVTVFLDV
jgi:F0F1-type ATP synthase epsilon subunit